MSCFGFIGVGNMGSALARALCKTVPAQEVLVTNRTAEKAVRLAAELGCRTAADNAAAAREADMLFLGVKPQMMKGVLAELAPVLKERTAPFTLISMAAGLSIGDIQRMAGGSYPVIRIMPNTPASIGAGMILYCSSAEVTPAVQAVFLQALSAAGRFCALPESLMDAGSALSGCGPAFVDLFVEALADGGVACGLSRAQAQELAAQTVLGSAALILESGSHPGVLKDQVCSPGGSTIQGVRTLEAQGFRSACLEAVCAAYEKTRALGK